MLETILASFLLLPRPVDLYSDLSAKLRTIATNHPATSEIVSIGQSDDGRLILALKVGSGPVSDLIVATHHGNEYGSTAVAMGAAEQFAREPIPGRTLYIIPVLNISGYNRGDRYERTGKGRVDPNRDYPGPCGSDGPFYSKATRALAEFVEQKQIVASATLHTFSPAVLYPWGFATRDTVTADEDTFIRLSRRAIADSNYQYGNSKDLLYAANGTFEDYSYWKHGVWSLLFEMGSTHSPSESQMRELVRVNVPGLRKFIQDAPRERSSQHAFRGRCDPTVQMRTVLE